MVHICTCAMSASQHCHGWHESSQMVKTLSWETGTWVNLRGLRFVLFLRDVDRIPRILSPKGGSCESCIAAWQPWCRSRCRSGWLPACWSAASGRSGWTPMKPMSCRWPTAVSLCSSRPSDGCCHLKLGHLAEQRPAKCRAVREQLINLCFQLC